eukprot:425752-Heterocapsa_arctica.AAC.1
MIISRALARRCGGPRKTIVPRPQIFTDPRSFAGSEVHDGREGWLSKRHVVELRARCVGQDGCKR